MENKDLNRLKVVLAEKKRTNKWLAEQFKKMPFYCLNENDTWYMYLKELAKQEKIRRSRLHPYTLFWEFRIDNVENKIDTKYIVKGIQSLPKEFLEEQGLINIPFFLFK